MLLSLVARSLRHSGLGLAAGAALSLLSVAAAAAAAAAPGEGLRITVERPRFTCESGGMTLSHVVFHPGGDAVRQGALPCCDGKIGCAQFLSTTTVVRPGLRWHG